MPITPLAVNTTLASMKERVRAQSNTVSPQGSGIIEPEMTNLIHHAIVMLRTLLGAIVDPVYSTNETVVESTNIIDVSTVDIANTNKISLYDATHGVIPLVSDREFDSLRTLYANTSLSTEQLFAKITSSTSSGLRIQTHRGSSKATPGTLTLTYPRNPVKATTEATKLDLPERYVPIAADLATVMVYRKLKQAPPAEIDQRVTSFIRSQAAMLGLEVTPVNG